MSAFISKYFIYLGSINKLGDTFSGIYWKSSPELSWPHPMLNHAELSYRNFFAWNLPLQNRWILQV